MLRICRKCNVKFNGREDCDLCGKCKHLNNVHIKPELKTEIKPEPVEFITPETPIEFKDISPDDEYIEPKHHKKKKKKH